MWEEPLATGIETLDDHHFAALVFQSGSRRPIALVKCAVNVNTRCGAYGEMNILDPDGGPRQTLRALVLLTRTALQHAQQLGITHVETDVPPKLIGFAQRLTALAGEPMPLGARRFAGDLAQIRTRTLDTTNADGDFLT
jgi:hypothetical protein